MRTRMSGGVVGAGEKPDPTRLAVILTFMYAAHAKRYHYEGLLRNFITSSNSFREKIRVL